jgi:hypothetical protein
MVRGKVLCTKEMNKWKVFQREHGERRVGRQA